MKILNEVLGYIGLLCLCICVTVGHAVYLSCFRPIGRIDFSTSIEMGKPFDVYSVLDRNAYVTKEKRLDWWPWWMEHDKIYGRIYESNIGEAHLDIHVYKACDIKLRFLGSDAPWKSGRLNPKITFSSIRIDNKEILTKPKTVWHDNGFYYILSASPGLIKIDAVWHYPIKEKKI